MPDCLFELQIEIDNCVEKYDDGHSNCTQRRDAGYNSCSGWGIFSFICIAWTWISNLVCVAWEWIKNIICIAWAVIKIPQCILYNNVPSWIIDSELGRNVPSIPHELSTGFNISKVLDQHSYTDSGTYYEVRINANGKVEYKEKNNNWALLLPEPEGYNGNLSGPVAISYSKLRGRGNLIKNEDNFDMFETPVFDMIAASEDRIIVKEKNKDNFYIASIVRDFCCFKKFPSQRPINVPGYYAKLDPQCFAPDANDNDFLLINKEEYNRHISLIGFLLYNISRKLNRRSLINLRDAFNGIRFGPLYYVFVGLAKIAKPDLMIVQFDSGIWNLLDTRPPKSSGKPPDWVPTTYEHVTYGWEIPRFNFRLALKRERSIKFHKVLGMGVGRLHRHTHYDSSHGGELHVLAFNTGPVADFGSFYDGTCNYFILCQLKPTDTITGDNLKDAFGLLWIDEQTYYSERWRLVHPTDDVWGSRGIASYGGPNIFGWWKAYEDPLRFGEEYQLKKDMFWCPFKEGYININSRLAVARQTIIVSGRKKLDDANDVIADKEWILFSIVFSWGSIDRTWRWRRFPKNAEAKCLSENEERAILKDGALLVDLESGDTFYPQLIGLRDDMTIYVRGTKIIGGIPRDGYWYQKYLPADNWERPFIDENAVGEEKEEQTNILEHGKIPKKSFEHEWQFILKDNFNKANKFSHFGVYDIVKSRSQYYEISLEDGSEISGTELAECDEDTKWVDSENSLYILQPEIDYSAIEDQIDPPIDPFEALQAITQPLVKLVHRPPSLFNNKTFIKIINRPIKNTWEVPRFLALLWDKRDDDLLEFSNLNQTITFMYDPDRKNDVLAGKLLKIKLKKRQVLWKPPVVQKAFMSLDTVNQVITVGFCSKIERQPRYLQHWKRIEAYRGLGIDLLKNVQGAAYSIMEPNPDDVNPYNDILYPCPDITIYKIKINVIIGQINKVKLEKTIDAFDGEFEKDSFYFMCHWNAGEEGSFNEMTKYLIEPGNFEHATNLIFEDIIGHVTTPQITEFLIGGCMLDPLVSWDENQHKLVGDLIRGNEIKITNRSRENKILEVIGGVVGGSTNEGSYSLTSKTDVNIQFNNSSGNGELSILISNVTDNTLQPVAEILYRIIKENEISVATIPHDLDSQPTGGGTYSNGQRVTVTAQTVKGFKFRRWTESGKEVTTKTAYSFTVTGNRNLVAEYIKINEISVSTSPPDLKPQPTGGGTCSSGQMVTITAQTVKGFKFRRWIESGIEVSKETSYSFEVTGNRNLVAEYSPIAYTISVSTLESDPDLQPAGGGTYLNGQEATVIAVKSLASDGVNYNFIEWTEIEEEVSKKASYSFIVTGNRDLVAKYSWQLIEG